MKKIISIFLLLATVATASAQRFEWAKGIESCLDYGARIQSAVTDSLGNLYILGRFEYDAEWMSGNGGIPLLPEAQFLYQIPHISVLIAKISPEGEMLWKKVVCNDNGGGARPYDIRLVGDTAIACMFDHLFPTSSYSLYYLDTLYPPNGQEMPRIYPWRIRFFNHPSTLAFVTFDFDGNVIENHSLHFTAVDNNGNDIRVYYGALDGIVVYQPSFNIDREGNIYLYRITNDIITDSLSADKGAFSAIKIWDDTVLVGSFPVEGNPQRWWQQVLKFSPHFDTLLASRYVIQKSNYTQYHTNYYLNSIVDTASNLYTIISLKKSNQDDCYIIDSMQNMMVFQNSKSDLKGFLVKFDSALNAKWVVDFRDSAITQNSPFWSRVAFMDIAIDEDSGYVFLSSAVGLGSADTTNYYSVLLYNGEPLETKSAAIVTAFHNTDTQPPLHSYCRIPGIIYSDIIKSEARDNLTCKNNRIFMQANYVGGLRYGNTNQPAGYYDRNLGFFVSDYAGHVISHNSYDIDNRGDDGPGPVSLRDSILYLMPDIWTHATFGETTIYSCKSYACIAKYVDTSFMSLYVRPEPDAGIRPPAAMPSVTLYPNPATTSLSIVSDTPVAPQAYIINSIGIRMPATIQNNTLDVSRLSPGNYFLETYINNNKVITKFIKL